MGKHRARVQIATSASAFAKVMGDIRAAEAKTAKKDGRPLADEDAFGTARGDYWSISRFSRADLRRLCEASPTASACAGAVVDRVSFVDWYLADAADPKHSVSADPAAMAVFEFFSAVNRNGESFDDVLYAVVDDLVKIQNGAIQIVYDGAGAVAELYRIDAAAIVPTYFKAGANRGVLAGYSYRAQNGSIEWFWPWQIAWFQRGARSHSKFPALTADTLATAMLVEILMQRTDLDALVDGKIPPGILNFFDLDAKQRDAIEKAWANRTRARIQLTFVDGESKSPEFVPLSGNEKKGGDVDLEKKTRRAIQAGFGVPDNVLGFADDVNKANGSNLSTVFLDRGVKPVLEAVRAGATRMLRMAFRLTSATFAWGKIDVRDEMIQTDIDNKRLASGRSTINELRERDGEPPVPWGDEPFSAMTFVPTGEGPAAPAAESPEPYDDRVPEDETDDAGDDEKGFSPAADLEAFRRVMAAADAELGDVL